MKLLLQRIEGQEDNNIICSITNKSGVILYANQKFCEISGFTTQELVGAKHNIVNSRTHSYEFFHQMWTTISGGKIWQGEIKNKTKNGAFYWVDTIIFPIALHTDSEAQYLSVRTVIDDKKHAQVRNEQRLNELKQLLHTISHDMRQPITQILGLLEILNQTENVGDEVTQLLNILNNSAQKLNEYTRALTQQVEHIALKDKIK